MANITKEQAAALIASLQQGAAEEQPAESEVILSNLTVQKATDSGEHWLEGYSAELNCNVRLNQEAVDALEKAPFIRPSDPEQVSDKLAKMRLRGGVVRAVVGPVRVRDIGDGKTKREATMKKFVEVSDTSVKITKWAF